MSSRITTDTAAPIRALRGLTGSSPATVRVLPLVGTRSVWHDRALRFGSALSGTVGADATGGRTSGATDGYGPCQRADRHPGGEHPVRPMGQPGLLRVVVPVP